MSSDKQFSSKSVRMLNTEDEKEMAQIVKQCSYDPRNDAEYTIAEFQTDSPLINVTDHIGEKRSKSGFDKKKKKLKTFQKYEDHNYYPKRVTFETQPNQTLTVQESKPDITNRRVSRVEQSDTEQISSEDYFASFGKFEFKSGKMKQKKQKEKKSHLGLK